MTKETRVSLELDKYNNRMKALRTEYDAEFDAVPVNEAGEASSRAILFLNMKYTQESNKIENDFIMTVTDIFK